MQTPEARTHESLFVDLSARQLLAFVTVAETLSYVEAADLLHYTEPGIFAQVKRIEQVVGCRLLVRHGRGLRLTAEGATLLPACRAVLSGIERMDGVRQRLSQSRRLAVASGTVTGSYLLPAAIKAFTKQEPAIEVDLIIASGQDLIDQVAADKADVGVSGTLDRFAIPDTVTLRHWFEEPHALFSGDSTAPEPGRRMEVYVLSGAEGPLNLFRKRLHDLGLPEPVVNLRSSIEAIKGACAAGLGYALLPRRALQMELQTGMLHEVPVWAEGVIGHVWICERRTTERPEQLQAFLDFLQAFVRPNGDLPRMPIGARSRER